MSGGPMEYAYRVDSGDTGEGSEVAAIMACISRADVVGAAVERAEVALARGRVRRHRRHDDSREGGMNAPPLRIPAPRTYWHPLTVTAASIGARVEPMRHGHEVWHMGDVTMLVRVIDGVPHALDVCGTADAPFTGWVRPQRPFSAADMRREPAPTNTWMDEREAREREAERRADAREEARDYRRRLWREKSFQIE